MNSPGRLMGMGVFVLLAVAGCVRTDQDQQAPSNRADQPATTPQSNRTEVRTDSRVDRSDGGEAAGTPRAPRGEVKRNEYTVQVGLFNRVEEADQLAYELRALRVNNFVQPTDRQWRVCVGRYYSAARADRMLRQIQALGYTSAQIYPPVPNN